MYAQRNSLMTPDEDAILWRYMTFTKFASLLTKKALFFARADKFGDPFEGSLSALNVELSPVIHGNMPPEHQETLRIMSTETYLGLPLSIAGTKTRSNPTLCGNSIQDTKKE